MTAVSPSCLQAALLGVSVTAIGCLLMPDGTSEVGESVAVPLPSNVGDWELIEHQNLDPQEIRILRTSGHARANFRCRQTGRTVSVTLLAGAAGPLASHHPQVCYAREDYSPAAEAERLTVEGRDDRFWVQSFQARHIDLPSLTVGYGWFDGTQWRAPRFPRWQLSRCPRLQRIQVSVDHALGAGHEAERAVRQFLGAACSREFQMFHLAASSKRKEGAPR